MAVSEADRAVWRYTSGLLGVFLLMGLLFAIVIVPTVLARGRPDQALAFVDVWFAFGIPTILVLALIVGPLVLFARRRVGSALRPVHAAVLGAGAGPLMLMLAWLLFRERNETFAGLIGFWLGLPGEFIIGVLPHALAGAFFCWWITRRPTPL